MRKKNNLVFKIGLISGLFLALVLGIMISCEKKDVARVFRARGSACYNDQDAQLDYSSLEFCGTVVGKKLMVNQKEVAVPTLVKNDFQQKDSPSTSCK